MERRRRPRKRDVNKVTWDDIYFEFKERYPRFRNAIVYWRPYQPSTIKIYTRNFKMYIYNYDEKIVEVLDGDWHADLEADRKMEKHKRELLKTLIT